MGPFWLSAFSVLAANGPRAYSRQNTIGFYPKLLFRANMLCTKAAVDATTGAARNTLAIIGFAPALNSEMQEPIPSKSEVIARPQAIDPRTATWVVAAVSTGVMRAAVTPS